MNMWIIDKDTIFYIIICYNIINDVININMNKKEIIINISKEIAPVISSRDIIDTLVKKIEKADAKSIVLDFSNVDFVSRSATHALIKLKELYNKKWNLFNKKKLVFNNINESFDKMLQSVTASKNYMRRKVDFNPQKVTSKSLFEKNLI